MNNVRDKKRANKSLPFFFKDEFKVFFVIIFVSTILLVTTFTFDKVPPILNRGIQPATFPKGLLVLIMFLTDIGLDSTSVVGADEWGKQMEIMLAEMTAQLKALGYIN